MKVLFVNTNLSFGGAARATLRIIRSVSNRGVKCQILTKYPESTKEGDGAEALSIADFKPKSKLYSWLDFCANKVKNKWQHFQWRNYRKINGEYYLSDLRSIRSFGALQKLDYDILHLQWINGRFININELKKVRKPIVWTLHDSWAFCGVCHYFSDCDKYKTHCGACPLLWKDPRNMRQKDLAYRIFEQKKKIFQSLDLHIVTPSTWLGNCARQSALLGQFSVDVIPNSIDVEKFKARDRQESLTRWELDPQETKKYILYGAMNAVKDRRKGFNELLKALQTYQSLFDTSNTELIVFGAEGEIPTLQLDFPIKYIGMVRNDEDIAKLYTLADVMVVPSLTENLSNVIMESLSCGTPVVAFNIGGNSDMIDHMSNGYLAEDEAQMAAGIAWCLDNNADGSLSRNARQKVLDNFTSERVGLMYTQLYERITNPSRH